MDIQTYNRDLTRSLNYQERLKTTEKYNVGIQKFPTYWLTMAAGLGLIMITIVIDCNRLQHSM